MFHLFDSKDCKLLRQAEKGNIRKVARLLSKGANVNTRDEDGCTPLCSAVFCNHQEVAETLIAAGADVNVRLRDESVLMRAAWNGWLSTVKQLIAAGADVNAASNSGTTALIKAAAQGHEMVVRCLITSGEMYTPVTGNGAPSVRRFTTNIGKQHKSCEMQEPRSTCLKLLTVAI